MENDQFSDLLIRWYQVNKRDLPWRFTKNPYLIWLSEIILQQTRVQQGLQYYNKFVEAYPTVDALAKADIQQVLRLWQGLGYYSRARNLHSCAQLIVQNYGSKFPTTYEELLKLKGVGQYTAAAIASFAFKAVVPVVDGNVYRVLARIFGIKNDINASTSKKVFFDLAATLISDSDPDLFNQAIMEFGALHCTPKKPFCIDCPFSHSCYAFQNKAQNVLPVKLKKIKKKIRYLNYLVYKCNNKIVMKQRKAGDIWEGLFDFNLYESKATINELELLDVITEQLGHANFTYLNSSREYKHVLTHQTIFARFHTIELGKKENSQHIEGALYNNNQIKDLPKPILVNNYLNEAIF